VWRVVQVRPVGGEGEGGPESADLSRAGPFTWSSLIFTQPLSA